MVMHLLGGALLMAVAAFAGQGPPQAKWWESAEVKSRLNLTDAQARRIEEIYSNSLPERKKYTEQAERLAAELEALVLRAECTEEAVVELSERAVAAQALRIRTRLLMLYRMYRVLTPDQRRQLDQLAGRRHRDGSIRGPMNAHRWRPITSLRPAPVTGLPPSS